MAGIRGMVALWISFCLLLRVEANNLVSTEEEGRELSDNDSCKCDCDDWRNKHLRERWLGDDQSSDDRHNCKDYKDVCYYDYRMLGDSDDSDDSDDTSDKCKKKCARKCCCKDFECDCGDFTNKPESSSDRMLGDRKYDCRDFTESESTSEDDIDFCEVDFGYYYRRRLGGSGDGDHSDHGSSDDKYHHKFYECAQDCCCADSDNTETTDTTETTSSSTTSSTKSKSKTPKSKSKTPKSSKSKKTPKSKSKSKSNGKAKASVKGKVKSRDIHHLSGPGPVTGGQDFPYWDCFMWKFGSNKGRHSKYNDFTSECEDGMDFVLDTISDFCECSCGEWDSSDRDRYVCSKYKNRHCDRRNRNLEEMHLTPDNSRGLEVSSTFVDSEEAKEMALQFQHLYESTAVDFPKRELGDDASDDSCDCFCAELCCWGDESADSSSSDAYYKGRSFGGNNGGRDGESRYWDNYEVKTSMMSADAAPETSGRFSSWQYLFVGAMIASALTALAIVTRRQEPNLNGSNGSYPLSGY